MDCGTGTESMVPKPVVPEEKRRRRRPTKSGTVLSERLIVETALRMLRETRRVWRLPLA